MKIIEVLGLWVCTWHGGKFQHATLPPFPKGCASDSLVHLFISDSNPLSLHIHYRRWFALHFCLSLPSTRPKHSFQVKQQYSISSTARAHCGCQSSICNWTIVVCFRTDQSGCKAINLKILNFFFLFSRPWCAGYSTAFCFWRQQCLTCISQLQNM